MITVHRVVFLSYSYTLNDTSCRTSCWFVGDSIQAFLVNISLNISTHLSAFRHHHSNPDVLDSWGLNGERIASLALKKRQWDMNKVSSLALIIAHKTHGSGVVGRCSVGGALATATVKVGKFLWHTKEPNNQLWHHCHWGCALQHILHSATVHCTRSFDQWLHGALLWLHALPVWVTAARRVKYTRDNIYW